MNILQDIFRDHYEIIELTCHPRDVEMENIDRMIDCGNPELGGTVYACGKCGHTKYVPFRCHSRFCPTCGALYSCCKRIRSREHVGDFPGNTLEISQIGTHMAYGVDRKLRYVSWLAWSHSFSKGFSISKIPKVDFQKYLTGDEEYYILEPDVCCLGFDR